MMALAAVTAAEYSLVYPALVIISISIRPNPEASAVADPEIPANSILARILTCARPPRICPTRVSQNFTMLMVSPQRLMISLAKMNSGIHI